ncbi:hypothetical protein DFH08DRAFT_811239 [Mycena albidolilacea]|uniref:Uncharacterized protein n=1 Tax=Mycena albidolilacea TaxID=1033008 RepID=A0AAD6ZWD4_9AGAR|nr:hypothetical protein DFH08DRAFT_811239 [Mycena albidolilacea]
MFLAWRVWRQTGQRRHHARMLSGPITGLPQNIFWRHSQPERYTGTRIFAECIAKKSNYICIHALRYLYGTRAPLALGAVPARASAISAGMALPSREGARRRRQIAPGWWAWSTRRQEVESTSVGVVHVQITVSVGGGARVEDEGQGMCVGASGTCIPRIKHVQTGCTVFAGTCTTMNKDLKPCSKIQYGAAAESTEKNSARVLVVHQVL